MKKKSEFLILPSATDGDSRDSSLIVYTITVTISVSLFIFAFTVDRKLLWSVFLSFLAATFFLIATIRTLIAIELLVDITSFKKNNSGDEERFGKYKKVLLHYNWSVIFLIGASILLFVNLAFRYLNDLKLSFFSCLNNTCISIRPIIDLLIGCLSVIISYTVVTKWKKDIRYVKKADRYIGNIGGSPDE
jgi:hypothetical protein